LCTLVFLSQCNLNGPSYKCDLDTSKTGYELSADLDECLVLNAQIMTAPIEDEDIEILTKGYTTLIDSEYQGLRE
jgi:hypothetical protein